MALPEITLKDLKKKTSLTLSLQSERDQFIDTLGQRIDNLPSNVNNLSSKLARVESSLAVNKQLIMNYYNALLHLRGVFIAKTIRQKRLFGGCRYTIICWRQSTGVCVCVCVCVCACACICVCASVCVCLRPFAVKASSAWISWNIREQINDVMLKTLISYAKSLHRNFRMHPPQTQEEI